MLNWYFITSAQYKAAKTKDSESLYFLSDTKEIYRGSDLFTQSVIFYSELPTTPAVGQLYVDSATLEGKTYTGTEWKTVIKPVADTVTVDDANPVSGKAVAAYVTEALKASAAEAKAAFKEASYSKTTNKFTFTKNDGTSQEVEITNLPVDMTFTKNTETGVGLLQMKDKAGNLIGTGVNLDLERFVKSGKYDTTTKKITLYFDDEKTDKVEIDAAALVDIYTGASTSTADVTVSKDNKISVTVKASAEDGNLVQVKEDGLYVAPVDQSAKMDKDADAVAGNLAKFDANGNAIDGGVKAGGATLAETPNSTTLATEAAVNAVKSALETKVNEEKERAQSVESGLDTAVKAAQADATKGITDAAAALKAAKDEETRATGVEGNLDKAVKAAQADATKGITDAAAAKTAADKAQKTADDEVARATAKENELVAALTWKTTIA